MNTDRNAHLFSIWDSKSGSKAEPAHENCKRNLNDGRSMGTKCMSTYEYKEGVLYEIYIFKSSSTEAGDYWTSLMHDKETDKVTTVGIIFLENDAKL